MEQNPTWEAKVHHYVQKTMTLDITLSQIIWDHNLPSNFSKICFTVFLPSIPKFEWLELLNHIWVVESSNLSQKTAVLTKALLSPSGQIMG